MKSKWQLFEAYFTKAGQYEFGEGEGKMVFKVGPDRIFEINDVPKFPLYVIANAVREDA